MNLKKIKHSASLFFSFVSGMIVVSSFFLGTHYIYAQWTEPTCAPPGCNAEDPINIGDTAQYKSGALSVGGDVGIGTNAPQSRLDVVGGDINIDDGHTIYSRGRMHIYGEEDLYLLNKGTTYVSQSWGGTGNLVVQGTLHAKGVPTGGIQRVCTNDSSGFKFFRDAWGNITWDGSGGGPCFGKGIACTAPGSILIEVSQGTTWGGSTDYGYTYMCIGV